MRNRVIILTVGVVATLLGMVSTGLPRPGSTSGAAPALPASTIQLPAGWPSIFPIGVSQGLGDASEFHDSAPVTLRYQYLAGGVNTGAGWTNWSPDASFVTHYIAESRAVGAIPVFTYYMMLQSAPGSAGPEQQRVQVNAQNPETMRAYYDDLLLLFQRIGLDGQPVVLHLEPDLWGFMQQRAGGQSATRIPVAVRSSGAEAMADLPDSLAGFAQGIARLRDHHAPNVLLAYHVSVWGTGTDILRSKPSEATIDSLANDAATFYESLGVPFDLLFSEFSDRDAAFKEHVYGDRGSSWWRADDHQRHGRFLGRISQRTERGIVLWQIPVGHTRLRAMNNTWGHYQDTLAEWLLDDSDGTHIQAYRDAGVIGLLFGPGTAGVTCYCDGVGDGLTNPEPINGKNEESLSDDDDGGFLRARLAAYFASGGLPMRSTQTQPIPGTLRP